MEQDECVSISDEEKPRYSKRDIFGDSEEDNDDNEQDDAGSKLAERKQSQKRNLKQWYRQFTAQKVKEEEKIGSQLFESQMEDSHKASTTLGRGLSNMLVTKML